MDIRIKKGLDLKLAGGIEDERGSLKRCDTVEASEYAICPDDFPGFKPKACVKEGEQVESGHALLYNKDYEDMTLVSPVRGRVKAIVRGDRRKILRVEIDATDETPATIEEFRPGDDRASIIRALARSGLLARFRERPYDIVPRPRTEPVRDIYVSCFDAAPLAADKGLAASNENDEKLAESGLRLLTKLSAGKVYVAMRVDGLACDMLRAVAGRVPGAEVLTVSGPYPSSLPGSLIAATSPINKGETIWTLDLTTLLRVGELVLTGRYSFENIVALTGSEIKEPRLVKACDGVALKPVLEGSLKEADRHLRIISGNVLTGVRESEDGFLHFPYDQITVIPEGDDKAEFMGWASISPSKVSANGTFPLRFMRKLFSPDARLNGGRRAMIMSGEYDKYMPMDILPEYLLKAIMAKDVEGMERLGIYEVAPEDFALAEFADTSKLPLQQIVRDGLDYLRKELE